MTQRTDNLPHVVHIIDELPPDGAERLLVDILRHRSAAFRFSVVCLIRGGELEEELRRIGVPVVILGRTGRFDLGLLFRLAGWLRSQHVSVVHTHLFTADAWGRAAAVLAGVRAIFTTVHNTNEWKESLHRSVDRLLSRFSTRVIACSDAVREVLRNRDYLPSERVVTIPNGIDLARFQGVTPGNLLADLGISYDGCLLGVIGRLHPAKGHEDLIPVLSRIRDEGSKFHCLFVGDGELRPQLEDMTRHYGLESHITFTGQRRDVPRILAALDILVMPSRWEGLPMALLEAMAIGKAVLATTVGGIPEVIKTDDNGVLVPPQDQSSLYSRLKQLMVDADLRARYGSRARDTVHARYSAVRTSAAYEDIYRAALGIAA
jgi:glycosyltransferase involved in cell wall biosynthesis